MTANFVRVPVRYIPQNQELLKALSNDGLREDAVAYKIDPSLTTVQVPNHPVNLGQDAPYGRANGNAIFRRYPDGRLDIEYAAMKVIDALHKAALPAPLNKEEQDALSCLFPSSFSYIDSAMIGHVMATSLRITQKEAAEIALHVADHIRHETLFMLSSHAR